MLTLNIIIIILKTLIYFSFCIAGVKAEINQHCKAESDVSIKILNLSHH